jgi:hypothetical protein
MAKTVEEIQNTAATIRLALPAAISEGRVTYSRQSAERGMLRLCLDGQLIGEWGHGVCGWVQTESAAWLGTEGRKVYSAAKRVLK